MRGPSTVALVVLLVSVPLAAGQALVADGAWTQRSGGPFRNGIAELPPGPLDVVASYRLIEGTYLGGLSAGSQFNARLVATPVGAVGIDEDGEACTFIRLEDPRAGLVRRGSTTSCPSVHAVAAYDPTNDLVLSCAQRGADQPILEARRPGADGLVWAIVPERDLGAVPQLALPGQVARTMTCTGALVEDGIVHVAFTDNGANSVQVARIDGATGAVVRVVQVGVKDFVAGRTPAPSIPPERVGMIMGLLTRTDDGYVLTTFLMPFLEVAVAWFDDDLDLVGTDVPEGDEQRFAESAGRRAPVGSEQATARGSQAALVLGDRVVLIDTAAAEPVDAPLRSTERFDAVQVFGAPAWWGQTIVLPLAHSVLAVDSASLEVKWPWLESKAWRVSAITLAPPGDVYVLAGREGTDGAEAAVFRVDLQTGATKQRIPLPMTPRFTSPVVNAGSQPVQQAAGFDMIRWWADLLPLGDGQGVLVHDIHGDAVLLSAADAAHRPDVGFAAAWPAIDEQIGFTLPSDDATVDGYLVNWGDGPEERLAPGEEATHQYASAGTVVLRVTAVHRDGRTATTEVPMHVGATPPPELNFMQQAFSPERQDMTWGIIGILIAVGGGLYAFYANRRRHGRLDDRITRLEAIRAQGLDDPDAALFALDAFRRGLHDDLGARRLEDGQYALLDQRATRLAQSLRSRLLAPFEGRLTASFRRVFDAALQDGYVTPTEARLLLDELAKQSKLAAHERQRLGRILTRWADEAV